jgi:transmembrane sensor
MDSQERYDEETWNLMLSAFQGTLTAEEERRFNEWLGSSTANRELYERMALIWKEGLEYYPVYEQADEKKAWEALQLRMGAKPVLRLGTWTVAAVLFMLVAGAGWWFFAGRDSGVSYVTGPNETKEISLPDGSSVSLQPETRLERLPGYNKSSRGLKLVSGTAIFDVVRLVDKPFHVDMDGAEVRDIGTRFRIEKTADSIRVAVESGRIAFVPVQTGDIREVGAGGAISLYTDARHGGELHVEAGGGDFGEDSLKFDNTPLTQILEALARQSGKKIVLRDVVAGQKRLTLHLNGESLESALRVICASVNLEYRLEGGEYVLKKRAGSK